MITEKLCKGKHGCGEIKATYLFPASKKVKDGFATYCRECYNKMQKKDFDNPSNRIRKYTLQKKFGITPDIYEAMFKKQKGVCAACKKPEKSNKRYLCIDHIHGTNPVQVRGLLCTRCNMAIGYAGDSIIRLRSIIAYLEKNEPLLFNQSRADL